MSEKQSSDLSQSKAVERSEKVSPQKDADVTKSGRRKRPEIATYVPPARRVGVAVGALGAKASGQKDGESTGTDSPSPQKPKTPRQGPESDKKLKPSRAQKDDSKSQTPNVESKQQSSPSDHPTRRQDRSAPVPQSHGQSGDHGNQSRSENRSQSENQSRSEQQQQTPERQAQQRTPKSFTNENVDEYRRNQQSNASTDHKTPPGTGGDKRPPSGRGGKRYSANRPKQSDNEQTADNAAPAFTNRGESESLGSFGTGNQRTSNRSKKQKQQSKQHTNDIDDDRRSVMSEATVEQQQQQRSSRTSKKRKSGRNRQRQTSAIAESGDTNRSRMHSIESTMSTRSHLMDDQYRSGRGRRRGFGRFNTDYDRYYGYQQQPARRYQGEFNQRQQYSRGGGGDGEPLIKSNVPPRFQKQQQHRQRPHQQYAQYNNENRLEHTNVESRHDDAHKREQQQQNHGRTTITETSEHVSPSKTKGVLIFESRTHGNDVSTLQQQQQPTTTDMSSTRHDRRSAQSHYPQQQEFTNSLQPQQQRISSMPITINGDVTNTMPTSYGNTPSSVEMLLDEPEILDWSKAVEQHFDMSSAQHSRTTESDNIQQPDNSTTSTTSRALRARTRGSTTANQSSRVASDFGPSVPRSPRGRQLQTQSHTTTDATISDYYNHNNNSNNNSGLIEQQPSAPTIQPSSTNQRQRTGTNSTRARHNQMSSTRGAHGGGGGGGLLSVSHTTLQSQQQQAHSFTNVNSSADDSLSRSIDTDPPMDHELRSDIKRESHELQSFVSTCEYQQLDEDELCTRIQHLGELYKQFLPRNLPFVYKSNIEQELWLNAFHGPLEILRKTLDTTSHYKPLILRIIEMGITYYGVLARSFSQQYNLPFDSAGTPLSSLRAVELKFDVDAKNVTRDTKLAKSSLSKFMLALGDLDRYRCQVTQQLEYGKARTWYLKSSQMSATNGRVYNNLAILALHTQRIVEMMYYYMRALAARYKFEAARQSLDALIYEIAKRAKKITDDTSEQAETSFNRNNKVGKSHRRPISMSHHVDAQSAMNTLRNSSEAPSFVEVWHAPDGYQVRPPQEANECKTIEDFVVELLVHAGTRDLYKHAIMYTLHVCGMVHNKIDMQHFDDYAEWSLLMLRALLQRDDTPLKDTQWMHLCTICMHIVHHTAPPENMPNSGDTISEKHNNALQFTFSLWAVLIEFLLTLLTGDRLFDLLTMKVPLNSGVSEHDAIRDPQPQWVDQLLLVLPAVSLMCRWMSEPRVHKLYSAARIAGVESARFSVNIWASFCDLWNLLDDRRNQGVLVDETSTVPNTPSGSFVSVLAPEDALTLSFNGVFEASQQPVVYLPNVTTQSLTSVDSVLFGIHHRLNSILRLGDFLEGMQPASSDYQRFVQLVHNPNTKSGMTLTPTDVTSQPVCSERPADRRRLSSLSPPPPMRRTHASDEVRAELLEHLVYFVSCLRAKQRGKLDENETALFLDEDAEDDQPSDPTTAKLRRDIDRLKLRQRDEQMKQSALEQEQTTGVILDVYPTFLVPDTNALIDHLSMIVSLAARKGITIVLPTTVANELKGLSGQTSSAVGGGTVENQWLRERARDAFDTMNTLMDTNNNVRCRTQLGSDLSNMKFINEAFTNEKGMQAKMINDDKILECCKTFVDDSNRPQQDLKNEPLKLTRKVVLLTEDRALRLKAMHQQVPVRSLPEFMKWIESYDHTNRGY